MIPEALTPAIVRLVPRLRSLLVRRAQLREQVGALSAANEEAGKRFA
jgi:hypothetical protein